MSRKIQKVGANDACPCASGRKYKACCRTKVDWEVILGSGDSGALVRHLSIRGKNKLFLNLAMDALQIDTGRGPVDFPVFKKAFTSSAVRKVYEALQFVWPDGQDLKRVLSSEAAHTSGLYIGRYEPDLVSRGVTRHSLYADRILLVDPLLDPRAVREEFNPILHPEEHRATTLKWINLWLSLAPWIEEGIVGFVRAPGDFYPTLAQQSVEQTQRRFAQHPELAGVTEAMIQEELESEQYREFLEDVTLSEPDEQIRSWLRETKPDATEDEVESLIRHVHRRREDHPYFLEPENAGPSNELRQISTGANYEQAKMIALHSRSYVMTDLRVRWREIELDRGDAGIDPKEWSPFAKAFHGLQFQFLESVPLAAALAIRREGRLESMRGFLRKTWNATAKTTPFDEASIPNLAAELEEKVREAEIEWRRIDEDLVKMVTAEAAAALLALGPAIASGHAQWLGAAAIATGIGNLIQSGMKRANYRLQYPGGFFVDLRDRRYT